MKLIALDSSGLVASVAILEDDLLRAEYTVDYKKTHSQTLLPMLDAIARMVELDLSTVDAIAVAAGPGSFTGLRIGSATAKGLGLALRKPIVEVPTLAALACNLPEAGCLICPVMDARRQQVYNGLYRFRDHRLVTLKDQRALSVPDLAAELNRMNPEGGVILLGDGVAAYRPLLDSLIKVPHCYAPANAGRQRAASVAVLGARLFREGRAVPAEKHAPVYLRQSQAERERALHDGGAAAGRDPFSAAAATPRVHLHLSPQALAATGKVTIPSGDAEGEYVKIPEQAVVREMTVDDIEAVAAMEETDSQTPWSANALLTYFMRDDTVLLVAEEDGSPVGFCGILLISPESEVLDITVSHAKRRRGIGRRLLLAAMDAAASRGADITYLEVREGNTPARRLYESLGFSAYGRRERYYTDPVEDAIVMKRARKET